MAIFYHSICSGLGFYDLKQGTPYKGSDRAYLSFLLGGNVGFAYPYLPESWKDGFGIYELEINDDVLVFLAKDGNDVPRYQNDNWDDCCIICTASEAVTLANSDAFYRCEVAFLDSDVKFGKQLNNLKNKLEEVLNQSFDSSFDAIQIGIEKLTNQGLNILTEYHWSGYHGIIQCKTLNAVGFDINCADFDSIKDLLANKPQVLIALLQEKQLEYITDAYIFSNYTNTVPQVINSREDLINVKESTHLVKMSDKLYGIIRRMDDSCKKIIDLAEIV